MSSFELWCANPSSQWFLLLTRGSGIRRFLPWLSFPWLFGASWWPSSPAGSSARNRDNTVSLQCLHSISVDHGLADGPREAWISAMTAARTPQGNLGQRSTTVFKSGSIAPSSGPTAAPDAAPLETAFVSCCPVSGCEVDRVDSKSGAVHRGTMPAP